ncbi:MAG: lipase family protein [Leptolyngbyaceae cyanobacterium bins.349]|nr:lipase family protein [Leptolyngbyaceae cyanobacterium bins.349]
MAKLNRRRLLFTGFSAGLTSTAIASSVQAQTTQPSAPESRSPARDDSIDAIFGPEGDESRRPPAPLALPQPTVSYDRALSKLLIRCSRLGMEQFDRGQRDPRYNGSIQLLDGYSRDLDSYRQVGTFTVTLDATTTLLPNLGDLGNRILRRIIPPTRVFIGFALASDTHNLIVFRGTSNPKEWIANLQARQSDYVQGGVTRGRVHTGFLRLSEQLTTQVRSVVNQLNPALPCLIAGHSLGGALATLTTADLAQTNAVLRPQLRLYTYAAPRVGDTGFVQFLSAIAPNNFRVINLADMVPMVPPAGLGDQQYRHAGQEWIFLDYADGDISTTHTITRYQAAIEQRIETSQMPTFPTACQG